MWPAAGVLAAAGILFRFPPDQYAIYPPCPVRSLTGLLCPGCGATHALAALLHGRLAEALHQNALVTLLLPAAVALFHLPGLRTRLLGPTLSPRVGLSLGVSAIVFTIFRNL